MIQRKQTVFLLLATLLGIAALWVPVGKVSVDGEVAASVRYMDLRTLAVLSGSCAAFSLLTVFLFANRPIQMRFAAFVSFLSLILLGYAVYKMELWRQSLDPGEVFRYAWGIALPPLMMFFNAIAFRLIKKDEDLVRSMDRFRE